jgi:hypothetical protein
MQMPMKEKEEMPYLQLDIEHGDDPTNDEVMLEGLAPSVGEFCFLYKEQQFLPLRCLQPAA